MNLVIDSPYLCHRAWFTGQHRALAYGGRPTGVLFGFLSSLLPLAERFKPDTWVFCFDSRHSLRRLRYPEYKANRRTEMSDAERAEREKLYEQINLLREDILPRLGFSNILIQGGREADDIIAAVVNDRVDPLGEETVIVSADEDLYQLLDAEVTIWQPTKGRRYSLADFRSEYGIEPGEWAIVKALAGCDSDNVPKIITGLGVSGAIKYITGRLKDGPRRDALRDAGEKIALNLWLTTVPLPGTVVPALRADAFCWEQWGKVCRENGLDSLRRPDYEDRWINVTSAKEE